MAILNYLKIVLSLKKREKEILGSHNPSQRGGSGRRNSAPLGAVAIAIVVAMALLTACPTAGGENNLPRWRTTRIGNVNQFGVSEENPTGLAAIGSALYMVGSNNSALYTINIDSADETPDGMALRVGNVTRFGVNEFSPHGLAAIGSALYMVGSNNSALYTINIDNTDTTPDGMALRVGNVVRFGVNETGPAGLAVVGSTLYMIGEALDSLFTLNINNGMALQVGNVTRFGVGEFSPSGLAAIGNTLYMVGTDRDVLYSLNIDNADGTPDGTAIWEGTAPGFGIGENDPAGLAAIGNTLYMVGGNRVALYALRYQ